MKTKDTLVIVGGYTGTRLQFDETRDDCDVIMFNEAPHGMPWGARANICMQIHDPVIWRNPTNQNDPHHYERLKSSKIPILMQDVYEDVPMSVKYPLEEITAKYGDFLLSSSAAESIAWGLYMGYKRIELYGVEMATNTEYATQRPGVTYWLGMARGILGRDNVLFFHETFTTVVYGFEGDVKISEDKFVARFQELETAMTTAEGRFRSAEAAVDKLIMDYAEIGAGIDAIPPAIKEMIEASARLGEVDGALRVVKTNLEKINKSKQSVDDYITNRQMYERDMVHHRRNAEKFAKSAGEWGMETLKCYNWVKSVTGNKGKRKYRVDRDFRPALMQYKAHANHAGLAKGSADENQALMILLGELINAAGGSKSMEVMKQVGRA